MIVPLRSARKPTLGRGTIEPRGRAAHHDGDCGGPLRIGLRRAMEAGVRSAGFRSPGGPGIHVDMPESSHPVQIKIKTACPGSVVLNRASDRRQIRPGIDSGVHLRRRPQDARRNKPTIATTAPAGHVIAGLSPGAAGRAPRQTQTRSRTFPRRQRWRAIRVQASGHRCTAKSRDEYHHSQKQAQQSARAAHVYTSGPDPPSFRSTRRASKAMTAVPGRNRYGGLSPPSRGRPPGGARRASEKRTQRSHRTRFALPPTHGAAARTNRVKGLLKRRSIQVLARRNCGVGLPRI